MCSSDLKRQSAVGAGCLAVEDSDATQSVRVYDQMGSVVPGWSGERHPKLLVYSARVRGYDRAMALLVDSGASQNFASLAALKESPQTWRELARGGQRDGTVVRLADGTLKKTEGVRVRLAFSFQDFECSES